MYSKMVDHLLHECEAVTRPNEKPFPSREPSQLRQPERVHICPARHVGIRHLRVVRKR